jgi:hypothetical protein
MLSVIDDALNYLKTNGINIKFSMIDIITTISELYKPFKNEKEEVVAPGLTLMKLLMNIKNNPTLSHQDAILLSYCSLQLEILDIPISFASNNLPALINQIVNMIDQVFSFKPMPKGYENSNDITNKLNNFLKSVILCQKIKLYQPCLGQQADDGGIYQYIYTEWYLIRDGKMRSKSPGQMFIDLKNEAFPSYIDIYGPEAIDPANLEREFRFLAPKIGLDFGNTLNFHEEMIFSSTRINEMGLLHIDINDFKNLVKAKNNYRFFEAAIKCSGIREKLADDVTKLILSFEMGPMISKEELQNLRYDQVAAFNYHNTGARPKA